MVPHGYTEMSLLVLCCHDPTTVLRVRRTQRQAVSPLYPMKESRGCRMDSWILAVRGEITNRGRCVVNRKARLQKEGKRRVPRITHRDGTAVRVHPGPGRMYSTSRSTEKSIFEWKIQFVLDKKERNIIRILECTHSMLKKM
jgi:hypothetical protein